MAWEQRPSGRRFYYRKERRGGTCQSVYMGGGELGALFARLDELERIEQATARRAWRRQVAAQQAIDRQVDQVGAQINDLVAAVLLATGHHTHKRQWRRTRDDNGK